jgi:hypothetical protein
MTTRYVPFTATRQELAERWRLKLSAIQERYRLAVEDHERIRKEGLYANFEEVSALAGREQSRILAEYQRVLRIFCDLTLRGKIPGKELNSEFLECADNDSGTVPHRRYGEQ